MTAERVEEMLKTYRFEVGRCGHIRKEIELLTADIERAMDMRAQELAGPGAQVITGMPRGSAVGNPTERYGLMLASGWETEEIKAKHDKIAELEAEYAERKKTVDYVDRWLEGLPERERWIIETQVIDGVIWREVVMQYQERFGEYRSKDTLKRIRERAMDLIYDMSE